MSTTPQKEVAHETQETQQQEMTPPQMQEKQTQDTDTEEEIMASKDEEQKTEEETPMEEEEKLQEEETEEVKTPAKAATPVAKKTPSQATSAAKSATKRKFDVLHARNAADEPSISEHEKNKKARASALMKTPGTKPNGFAKKAPTKAREFSFARPTASSASRTAAVARDHANAKMTPTPTRKPLQLKRTPAKAQRASTPAPKTPTMDKTSRPHFAYTPYTGPLPPLTVESSFAPKGSQHLDRGARTASPAKMKMAAALRSSRPASAKKTKPQSLTGKENNGVNTGEGAATNPESSSKARTPVKSSNTVNKEQNRSAFKEKIKAQRSLAQQTGRSRPVAATVDPTA